MKQGERYYPNTDVLASTLLQDSASGDLNPDLNSLRPHAILVCLKLHIMSRSYEEVCFSPDTRNANIKVKVFSCTLLSRCCLAVRSLRCSPWCLPLLRSLSQMELYVSSYPNPAVSFIIFWKNRTDNRLLNGENYRHWDRIRGMCSSAI